MPRPRADQEGPTARERIEQAFWDLLEREPYGEITVRELASEAGVNHNTFYYHFDSIEDLASSAVPLIVSEPFVSSLMADSMQGSIDVSLLEGDAETELRYRHIRLLLGSASPRLLEQIKQAVFGCWFANLGLDADVLTPNDWAKADFVWGGLTSLISSDQASSFERYLPLLVGGIGEAVAGLLGEIVESHAGDGSAVADGTSHL